MNELTKNLAATIGHLETIIVGRDPIIRCTLTRSDLMRIAVDALASLKAAIAMLPASVDAPQLVVSFDSTHLQREIDRPFFDGKPFVLVDKVVRVTLDIEPPELSQEAQREEFGEARRTFHDEHGDPQAKADAAYRTFQDHTRAPVMPVATIGRARCDCGVCCEFRRNYPGTLA